MSDRILADNAADIDRELAWFRDVLNARLRLHHERGARAAPRADPGPPALSGHGTPYADVVRGFGMAPAERLVLMLAYAPHVRPEALDPFLIQNRALQRRFTAFGGHVGQSHGGFLPTGETAMFLLADGDTGARLRFHHLFGEHHFFRTGNVLHLDQGHGVEPPMSAPLRLTPEYVERLTTGQPRPPAYGPDFPAQRITTPLDWPDLVLDAPTRREVEEILAWVRHQDTLMDAWGLRQRLKAGFRSLFYGPPGTGKTLTASLLGRATGLSVFRIDLSKVVSKYIGETEKNLASLFDQAQHQRWILFFDEADALFGKRTESRTSNDRAANQQVSYLLQRIEDFPGVAILATNLRGELDEAFARRFQSMIHFRMPGPEQRLRLWEDNFRDKPYRLAPEVDLAALARDHELSGGSIINVLRHACLKAVTRERPLIRQDDLVAGVRRELRKEGRLLA